MKKLISSIITMVVLSVTAFADGFAVENEKAIPAPAPYDKENVRILWNTPESDIAGAPLICGENDEYVLLPVVNTVKKLSCNKGEQTAVSTFSEKVSESFSGAVSGNLLVQPTLTSVYAVNTDDMSIISSRTFGDITTDCAVENGLAYFGYKENDKYKFVCADTSDNFKTMWEYASDYPVTAPSKYGEFIVFGAGEKLVLRAENGDFIENSVNAQITNVFSGQYAVFMTCADDTVKKLRLESNGTAEEDSLVSCKTGSALTSPAEFNNRLYVGSADGFFVLDALNMEILKSYPELKNSAQPLVCYAIGQRAYTVAWNDKEQRDVLYSVLDTEEGQTLSEIIKIIDFTGGHYTVSKSGIMFFRNSDGRLWAIATDKVNVFVIAIKIILTIAIFVMLYIIFRAWLKKHNKNTLFDQYKQK